MAISFRLMTRDDLPLVHEWHQRPHVVRWWTVRKTFEETEEHYLPTIEGTEPTDHYLALLDGEPLGMIQTYLVSDNPEWEEVVGREEGLAGVDLLIGEEDAIGGGLGPRVLERFALEVVFARRATQACVATVEEANRRSWRAFEKAGFRHVRDVEEDGLPHRLMRLERRYAQ